MCADTVNEFVSEMGVGVGKNSDGLKQIMLDFIGEFAILLASDSTDCVLLWLTSIWPYGFGVYSSTVNVTIPSFFHRHGLNSWEW
jgi:hypothetical protein